MRAIRACVDFAATKVIILGAKAKLLWEFLLYVSLTYSFVEWQLSELQNVRY